MTGNGGGRWYNFWCDITQGGKDYRILSIRGTRQPFAIYACNVEHSRADYEMDILNCRNIVIYNLKSECNSPDLLIRDSDNIAVFSQGGDASTYPGGSLYHIENCTNFTLSLLYDYRINCSGHGPEYFSGTWFDPCEWHMLTETAPNGDVILLAKDTQGVWHEMNYWCSAWDGRFYQTGGWETLSGTPDLTGFQQGLW